MSLDLYFFFKINQFKILFVCKKLNAKLYLVFSTFKFFEEKDEFGK